MCVCVCVCGGLVAPVLLTSSLFIDPPPSSSLSRFGVWKEKEEMNEGGQMAIELGNPGNHTVLLGNFGKESNGFFTEKFSGVGSAKLQTIFCKLFSTRRCHERLPTSG